MPDWVYMVSVFVALTAGYFAGFMAGSWKSDRAPTPACWENVRKYGIDANKECAMREMDLNHEEQMEMIRRGTFDRIDFSEDDENDPD